MFSLTFAWLLATIALVVAEALTFNLITVWFAVGSAAALVVSLFVHSFQIQFLIFIVVSLLSLLAFRPLAAKLKRPPTPTNGDRNLGRMATALTQVSPDVPGRVRLDGVDWNARTVAGTTLEPGQTCRVVEIQSTLLFVEPQETAVSCS